MSKKMSPGEGLRQRAQPVTDLPGVEQLVSRRAIGDAVLGAATPPEHAARRRWTGCIRSGASTVSGSSASAVIVAIADRLQREHLTAAHARDLRKMVVLLALRGAASRKTARAAMLDRIGIRGVLIDEHRRFEVGFHACVIGGELVDAIWMLDTVAEDHLHRRWCGSLQPRDVRRVLAQLEDRLGADSARELRIRRFVSPPPARARRVHAQQEVGSAHPAPVEERRLVDDVVALRPSRRPSRLRWRGARRPSSRTDRARPRTP